MIGELLIRALQLIWRIPVADLTNKYRKITRSRCCRRVSQNKRFWKLNRSHHGNGMDRAGGKTPVPPGRGASHMLRGLMLRMGKFSGRVRMYDGCCSVRWRLKRSPKLRAKVTSTQSSPENWGLIVVVRGGLIWAYAGTGNGIGNGNEVMGIAGNGNVASHSYTYGPTWYSDLDSKAAKSVKGGREKKRKKERKWARINPLKHPPKYISGLSDLFFMSTVSCWSMWRCLTVSVSCAIVFITAVCMSLYTVLKTTMTMW